MSDAGCRKTNCSFKSDSTTTYLLPHVLYAQLSVHNWGSVLEIPWCLTFLHSQQMMLTVIWKNRQNNNAHHVYIQLHLNSLGSPCIHLFYGARDLSNVCIIHELKIQTPKCLIQIFLHIKLAKYKETSFQTVQQVQENSVVACRVQRSKGEWEICVGGLLTLFPLSCVVGCLHKAIRNVAIWRGSRSGLLWRRRRVVGTGIMAQVTHAHTFPHDTVCEPDAE